MRLDESAGVTAMEQPQFVIEASGLNWAGQWRSLKRNPRLLIGLAIVSVSLILALFGPYLAPYDPQEAHPGDQLLPPSTQYWMGTDSTGMDIFSRVLAAPRVDITIALGATLLSIGIGVPIGLVAGFYRNVMSGAILRVADLLQSFPVFILGMALVVLTGQRLSNVIFVLAIVSAPVYIRLTNAQVLQLKGRLFVEAARASGSSNLAVMFRHILPNSLNPVFALSSATVGFAILLTAGLSFVGAGVRPPTPEWGLMVATGGPNLLESGAWWPSVWPGVALSVTVLGYGMVSDSLAQLTDPRRRQR
jgi:peptide/nickel transport system permease protein